MRIANILVALIAATLVHSAAAVTGPEGPEDPGGPNDPDGDCPLRSSLGNTSNVFDPGLGDIFSDPTLRVFTIGDMTLDTIPDFLVVDYYAHPHIAAVACGVTGEIQYFLQSVQPVGYRFIVDAVGIGDADQDGAADFMIASYDGALAKNDVLVISGATGQGIARLEFEEVNPEEILVTPYLFTDIDQSGAVDSQDIYAVVAASAAGDALPAADANLDGTVGVEDAALAVTQAGTIPAGTVAGLAAALGGVPDGDDILLPPAGLISWIKKTINCVGCAITCSIGYEAAWDCRNQLKAAECQCWDLPDEFDVSACLDNLRLGFMQDCVQAAANAAGSCSECILECHPLAPGP